MKKNIITLIILIIIISCNRNKNEFKVSGIIHNSANQKIYLSELTLNNVIDHDSTILANNGTFTLTGEIKVPKFYIVKMADNNYTTLVVKPGDRIKLDAFADNLSENYMVSGSEDSELIRELTEKVSQTINKIDSLGIIYRSNISSPDIVEIKNRLDAEYLEIRNEITNYAYAFIENNLGSLAGLMALYAQLTPRENILNSTKDFKYFKMVDSVLYAKYPESDPVVLLHQQMDEIRQQIKLEEAMHAKLGIGTPAPDISLPNPQGDTVALSSLRGKYVLLDFWASWCASCRKKNPDLVAAYYKYKNKGFEIYQVSLDKTRDAWLKGIKEDKLNWTHVSDLAYWNSSVVPLYNIQSIPVNFLLNKDGVIIATNLSGDRLLQKLNEVFD